jgi:hypothetical protein
MGKGESVHGAKRPEEVTIERWEYDNPSWEVTTQYPFITTTIDGKPVEELVVEVRNRETGEGVSGVGGDLVMALAMVTHRLRERAGRP